MNISIDRCFGRVGIFLVVWICGSLSQNETFIYIYICSMSYFSSCMGHFEE